VDQSSGAPTSRLWYFAGGVPSTSNLQNPVVVYNSPGVYPVALVVNNSNGTDSIYYNSFVEVLSPANSFNISIYVDSLVAPQVGLGYQWYYNNALIPGANSMVLKNFLPGLYAVAVTDSNGCVNYSTTAAVVIGLQEQISESLNMEVYPNPAKDQTTIKLNSSLAGNANVIITDLNGKSVFEKVVNVKKGIQEFTIDCNQFNLGIYLVTLQSQEMISSKKLMIIH
jgi:PKD repeat protein